MDQQDFVAAMEGALPSYTKTYSLIFRTTTLYLPEDTTDELRPKDRDLQRKAHLTIQRELDRLKIPYVDLPSSDPHEFVLANILSVRTERMRKIDLRR